MGRTGVTLLDVEKAALQLQGRGKNPTVDAIRELLGTGSKSTITQHLNTWKSKNHQAQGKLPIELLSLVTGLWERLNTQTDQRITEIETSNDQKIQSLNLTLQQSQRDLAGLKTHCHTLEKSLTTERQMKINTEKQLHTEQQEQIKIREKYQAITQQCENQKADNIRMHQLAAQIQANLEHYQHAMQQARTEQSLILEKQQQAFQHTSAELQRELAFHRQQSNTLEQQLAQKETEWQHLNTQHDALQQHHDHINQQLHTNSQELTMFRERYDQACQQLQIIKIELNQKDQQLMEFEKQTAILNDQRNRLQKELLTANDKIEILREEKQFLLQEKSQLEGYVKQVEKKSVVRE